MDYVRIYVYKTKDGKIDVLCFADYGTTSNEQFESDLRHCLPEGAEVIHVASECRVLFSGE